MTAFEQKVKYVYNSNRLDGVHIPYEKTLELLQDPVPQLSESGIVGMDGKTEYERNVVLSHMAALLFVERLARAPGPFAEDDVKEVHTRLMEGVILSAGEYRECTLNYKAIPPVAPGEIPRRMQRVVKIMNLGLERAKSKDILAWQVHHEFLYVHPFIEGNGRTARLLLNLMRLRSGLDLEVIPFAERERYIRSVVEYGKKLAASQAG